MMRSSVIIRSLLNLINNPDVKSGFYPYFIIIINPNVT